VVEPLLRCATSAAHAVLSAVAPGMGRETAIAYRAAMRSGTDGPRA
jgi:hypothetical protein